MSKICLFLINYRFPFINLLSSIRTIISGFDRSSAKLKWDFILVNTHNQVELWKISHFRIITYSIMLVFDRFQTSARLLTTNDMRGRVCAQCAVVLYQIVKYFACIFESYVTITRDFSSFLRRKYWKMLNQVSVEAVYSATYVENYLDCVENLPNDLQRLISRMRELDVIYIGRN